MRMRPLTLALVGILAATVGVLADDWPQWLGPKRDGYWRETGTLQQLPTGGPPIVWRVPVNAGYVGPAVVGNRIYLVDRQAATPPPRQPGERALPEIPGQERLLCLDAQTGAKVWDFDYDRPYRISYPAGPRATPVVSEGRVYMLGAMGDLRCHDAAKGRTLWARNLCTEFAAGEAQAWGWAAHPLLVGDTLYCLAGGTNSLVVAFNATTGQERWRALGAREAGYAPPMLYHIDGSPTLVVWHPDAVCGLDPANGRTRWQQPYPIDGKPQRPEVTIATPRWDGTRLFLSSFYHGATLLEPRADSVRVIWNRHSTRQSEFNEGLHTVMCTSQIKDGHLYGVCGFGELRCLDLATGDRKWESLAATGGSRGLFGHAFLIPQGDLTWIWNDQGELILSRLDPQGFHELGRAKLLEPVENTRGRDVLWCHPAFANRRMYVHNGRELICVDLAAKG
jgi:outer membrane protein assembly factor BamB